MLLREIEKGGLSSAIRVCSEQAQEKTREFSAVKDTMQDGQS